MTTPDKLLDLAKSNLDQLQTQWENREELISKASQQTNTILDSLDDDLEKLESKALNTLYDVKNTLSSWWGGSSLISSSIPPLKYSDYITNGNFNPRVTIELQNLESDVNIYSNTTTTEESVYELNEENLKDLELIKSQNDLHLLSTLALYKGDQLTFWKIYFQKRNDIVEKDKARKEILKEESKDDEEFNWDDEE